MPPLRLFYVGAQKLASIRAARGCPWFGGQITAVVRLPCTAAVEACLLVQTADAHDGAACQGLLPRNHGPVNGVVAIHGTDVINRVCVVAAIGMCTPLQADVSEALDKYAEGQLSADDFIAAMRDMGVEVWCSPIGLFNAQPCSRQY